MHKKSISISNLQLDLDNSRYPEAPESQRDAIIKMVELQGDKLLSLAKDIIEHGIDPSERLLVYKDENEAYTVSEGNRRVTALKLLNQPNIIDENGFAQKIKDILKKAHDVPSEIDCVVFDNEEDLEHWVNLKHTGENQGAGRVRWTGQETDRHRAKRGNLSFGNQLLTFIHKEKEISTSILESHRKLKITNINRLLGDPDVRKALGLESIDGILSCYEHKHAFTKKISLILEYMLETDENDKVVFTVDRIKKKQDRKDFIQQLSIEPSTEKLKQPWTVSKPSSFVEPPKGSSKQGSEGYQPSSDATNDNHTQNTSKESIHSESLHGIRNNKKSNGSSSVRPNPNRNNLIPATISLSIDDKKCAAIFKELKSKLRHDEQPNSIAVMIRVFIELSVSHYIDKNHIQMESTKTGLHDKIVKVSDHLHSMSKIDNKQKTAILAASSDTVKSKGSLQQYVHNKHMFPDKSSINATWDNFEHLFTGIWS